MGVGTLGFTGFVTAGGNGGGGGGTGPTPIKVTSADFAGATEWDGANDAGRVITPADTLQVFANFASRYLDQGTEWERTALGVNILLEGFDAEVFDYTFYISVS